MLNFELTSYFDQKVFQNILVTNKNIDGATFNKALKFCALKKDGVSIVFYLKIYKFKTFFYKTQII